MMESSSRGEATWSRGGLVLFGFIDVAGSDLHGLHQRSGLSEGGEWCVIHHRYQFVEHCILELSI